MQLSLGKTIQGWGRLSLTQAGLELGSSWIGNFIPGLGFVLGPKLNKTKDHYSNWNSTKPINLYTKYV